MLGLFSGGRARALKLILPQPRDPHRFGVGALVLLQVAAFAVLPAADAVLEAGWAGTAAHIEAENGEPCGTGHSHLLCQLTRTASLGFAPLGLDALLTVAATGPGLPTATAWPSRPMPLGGSGPRAPPQG